MTTIIIHKGNPRGKQKDTSATKVTTSADTSHPIEQIDQSETNKGHQSSEQSVPTGHLDEHGGHVDEHISQQQPDLVKPTIKQACNPSDQIDNGKIESKAEQDNHKSSDGKINCQVNCISR